MLKHLEVVCIPVRDQEIALAFYRDKLGMRVVNDSPMGENMRWVQLVTGEDVTASISLVTWYEKMQPGGLQGLVFSVEDIEAASRALQAAGVTVGKIDDTPWGRFAMFSDPDGNGLTLRQP